MKEIDMKEIDIRVIAKNRDFMPHYATEEAAGADLKAAIDAPRTILPGEISLIPTGVSFEIPPGYEVQVRPRSGLALRYGITVLNSPGTVDSDYRGEIQVILINHGKEPFEVTPKMRIAQMVAAPVSRVRFAEVGEIGSSTRAGNGFGHTGTH